MLKRYQKEHPRKERNRENESEEEKRPPKTEEMGRTNEKVFRKRVSGKRSFRENPEQSPKCKRGYEIHLG
jgi:hypothetical protein